MSEIPGIKLGYIIAGFAGGVVSLRYVQGLNWWQGCVSVFGGAAVANYLTPVLREWLTLSESSEYGVAFIAGLCALNLTAGIFKLSQKFKENPKIPGGQQ